MLSTFLILPTNLFLAQWRFQPVEHQTLFKLQNNLTDGYLRNPVVGKHKPSMRRNIRSGKLE